MNKQILLGDEAVALAAIHAGISGAFAYPGTPATEIFEYITAYATKNGGIHANWSTNEKSAYEEAMGMSYAGRRAIVSMKHVGLNVAADPFMNSANTGAHGGLVVAVADDPGMHSSQNEQDTRYYGQFAHIPIFEPSDHQQAYDMTYEAFALSEKYKIPVLLRLVTRLAHSRSVIVPKEPRNENELKWDENTFTWTLLPSNARSAFIDLLEKYDQFKAYSDETPYNELRINEKSNSGIIASGIAVNYVKENLSDLAEPPSTLFIKFYPLPREKLHKLVSASTDITIFEDGYPFIESYLNGPFGLCDKNVHGKLSGNLPRTGELNPDLIRTALKLEPRPTAAEIQKDILVGRPPALCQGCPHRDTYKAMKEALEIYECAGEKPRVMSDIGCYTLGYYPPYSAIHSCVDMGASVSMASGAAYAGIHPSVCAIGDSTFTHSGMTPLLAAAQENTPMTVVIMDNGTVAMTGFQPTMAEGDRLKNLIVGIGVDPEHIRTIKPLPKNHEQNVKILREEFDYEGLSVVISQRPCIHILRKKG